VTTQPRILRVGEEPPPLTPAAATDANRADRPKGQRSCRGRFQTVNAFLDVTMAGLDRAGLAVWLILWRDTKPDGLARTSQADLARRAGCTVRTVGRALTALRSAGLVEVVRQGGLQRRLSVYRCRALAPDGAAPRSAAPSPAGATADMGVRQIEDMGVPNRGHGRPLSHKGPESAVPCCAGTAKTRRVGR
jgi:hypothetical protein